MRHVFVVLIHGEPASLEPLKDLLRELSIETWSVGTCAEVARLMDQTQPELVLTDKLLPDGTWLDVVGLAEKAAVPTNVIVVGECEDVHRHGFAPGGGAFGFIPSPLDRESIALVLQLAVDDVRHRRKQLAASAVA